LFVARHLFVRCEESSFDDELPEGLALGVENSGETRSHVG
jgi:hypothetical protein